MRRLALLSGGVLALAACAAPPRHGAAEGSRVVLVSGGQRTVLSSGLAEARGPAISPDGKRVFFSGRSGPDAVWQIFEASLDGGILRVVTRMPAGASSPALLADETVVFVSPPFAGALWAQPPDGGPARRLTFGARAVSDPTVLDDGRILFVSTQPGGSREALFAVNNDGTGVTAYAGNHEGAPHLRRPRELGDGRVAFLASEDGARWHPETVLSARPFKGRTVLAEDPVPAALDLAPRRRMPMGRLSTVNPAKRTGFLLCLDANRSTVAGPPATRVRILAGGGAAPRPLGEIALAADGSFAAEVPADVPLGIEALDASGRVVRSLAPWIWVRPGESRGCVGCHEPYGMAPRNRRPLAVKEPPVLVGAGGA